MTKTILVVEDDKLLGKSLKATFEDAGYSVLWSKNSDDVFKMLPNADVQLIYLDIMLPGGMDGYQILQLLKKPDSAYRHIPVIMLSNLGQLDEIERATTLGALDYAIKANIDLDELVVLTQKNIGNP